MYKEHILITQNNFINYEEYDEILNSLLISMPVKIKGKK